MTIEKKAMNLLNNYISTHSTSASMNSAYSRFINYTKEHPYSDCDIIWIYIIRIRKEIGSMNKVLNDLIDNELEKLWYSTRRTEINRRRKARRKAGRTLKLKVSNETFWDDIEELHEQGEKR